MVPELALSLETRGRRSAALETRVLGAVTESDLALLGGRDRAAIPTVKKLRDRHHALARALAQGMSEAEASLITGYDPSRISVLKNDPAFGNLLSEYRKVKDGAFADFQERASVVTLEALNIVADRLEDTPEDVSLGQALEIVKTLADRTGHAPIAKSVQVSATVDLTDRLTRARQRVIEGKLMAAE